MAAFRSLQVLAATTLLMLYGCPKKQNGLAQMLFSTLLHITTKLLRQVSSVTLTQLRTRPICRSSCTMFHPVPVSTSPLLPIGSLQNIRISLQPKRLAATSLRLRRSHRLAAMSWIFIRATMTRLFLCFLWVQRALSRFFPTLCHAKLTTSAVCSLKERLQKAVHFS